MLRVTWYMLHTHGDGDDDGDGDANGHAVFPLRIPSDEKQVSLSRMLHVTCARARHHLITSLYDSVSSLLTKHTI